MSIIRKFKKQHPWVAIDKTPLEDARLSFKARGVMAYLLCKPDDWTVNLNHLTTVSEKDGKEAIQSALKELEKLGYIARYRGRNDKGRITGWELVVFETFDDAIAWRKENPKVELANSPEWAETPETKVQEPAKKKNQRRAKPADGKTQNQVQPDLENPESGSARSGKPDDIVINDSLPNSESVEINEGVITNENTKSAEPVFFEQPSQPPILLTEENQPTQAPTVDPKPLEKCSANLSRKKITTSRWRETGKMGKHGYPNVVNMQGQILELLPWMELNDRSSSGYGFNPEFEAFISKQQVKKKYFAEMLPGEFIAAIKDWIGKAATDDERFGQVMRRWEMFESQFRDEDSKTVKEIYEATEREKRWQAIAQNQPMPTEPQPTKTERKKFSTKDVM